MIRIDDLSGAGGSWVFDKPRASGVARSRHAVVERIDDAERRAREHGEWVVLMVAYEAAAAFDPALATADAPPEGTPYVWWQSFADRRRVAAPTPRPSPVIGHGRRPNRWPFTATVETVREHIAAGDVYQVNVTERFDGRIRGEAIDLYAALLGVQHCAFGAYVELGDRIVVSASPELFFRWDGDTITCRPMKGTAPRRPRPDDDEDAGRALAASPKERAENTMIIDLLRNDLGRIADVGSVRVPELFSLERYETVWQLTSTVAADVPAATSLSDVFAALFPCGSVTGAPKVAAMRIIRDVESDPRGVYCGAIAVLAPPGRGPRAVCSVPIRTAVVDPVTATFEYGAGGAITWPSDPVAENAEVDVKAKILTGPRGPLRLLETLRADSDGIHRVGEHLDRIAASARWFGFPFDRERAEAELAASVTCGADVERVRLLADERGEVTVERRPLDRAPTPVMLAVDTVTTRSDDPYCCHKTTWRVHYDEARARHRNADDVVLVNELGHVIETTVANIAYTIDGIWYCPPLSDGGLAGIARASAIADGRLTERSLRADELADCEQLAVLNDLRGWRPARLVRAPIA